MARLWLSLLLLATLAGAAGEEFSGRRQKLREAVKDGVMVLTGAIEPESGELRAGFIQESNFAYLTGWLEPGAVLLMADGIEHPETLFLPSRDPATEKWTGRKTDPLDAAAPAVTKATRVLPIERFESELRAALEKKRPIYTVAGTPEAERLAKLAPLRDIRDISSAVTKLRQIKSEAEIRLLERSVAATLEAHRKAWAAIRPGLGEYEIAALMTASYMASGCERNAYAPIVGSGPNSTILHYFRNSRKMDQGDVLLMDVGAECAGYAADITRTVPVSGKFTVRQREIYDIVLGAQNAVIAAVKPGMTLAGPDATSLKKIAMDYFNSHGKDKNGEPLSKYFTHGLGHHVGLDVHDGNDYLRPLAAGMVITVEPGLYIPDEGFGVRIEDMLVVTETGARLMSGALPRDAGEIERLLRKTRE